MQKLSKAFLVMVALAIVGGPSQSRSLQVAGSAGYLSEWELNGTVTERNSASENNEFSGPLVWKHVGLCSVTGPEEKYGEIRFQLSSSGSLSKINATISLGGTQCIYNADLSSGSSGYMDCTDSKGIPISISIK
jgi:hypothetical protein